jgi:tetratricopeptide (TPR) repeat protein
MWRWQSALYIALVTTALGIPADAQRIASEQSRREAVQFYRAGQEFMAGEKFDRAAEEFAKAIASDALFTLAHYSLGQAYMNLQQYGNAVRAFQGCIEASRELYALAQTNRFEVEKRRDDDIREARETIQVLQRSGHPLLAVRAEQHLSDLERQRTSIAAGFRPPAEVLLSLGSAHFRSGDLPAAEAEWRAALDVNPKLGEAHNNLAVVLMMTDRFKEADEELRRAERAGFKVNPQFKQDLKSRSRGK